MSLKAATTISACKKVVKRKLEPATASSDDDVSAVVDDDIAKGNQENDHLDCPLCCDEKAKFMSKCSYCDAVACRNCLQQFIVSRKEEPKCYSCKKPYTDYFLAQYTTLTFRKKALRDHLKDVLWDQEQALLPSSQGQAAARLNEKRLEMFHKLHSSSVLFDRYIDDTLTEAIRLRKRLLEIAKKLKSCIQGDSTFMILCAEATNIRNQIKFMETFNLSVRPTRIEYNQINQQPIDVKVVQNEINELVQKKAEFFVYIINEDENKLFKQIFNTTEDITMDRKQVKDSAGYKVSLSRGCPKDDCRGFCDSKGICALCSSAICPNCWVSLPSDKELHKDHECLDSDLESKKHIVSSSKPCPTCRVLIFRVEGCDHMWCTNCKTGFNWRTGNLVHDRTNTNPMLAEWRRRTAAETKNTGDECRGSDRDQAMAKIRSCTTDTFVKRTCVPSEGQELCVKLSNCFQILMNQNRDLHAVVDVDAINNELRVRYLINEIDKTQFLKNALAAVRKSKSQLDCAMLNDMFFAAANSLIFKYVEKVEELNLRNRKAIGMGDCTLNIPNNPQRFKWCPSVMQQWTEFFKEWTKSFEDLRVYFNTCLEGIATRHYGSPSNFPAFVKNSTINENWRLLNHS